MTRKKFGSSLKCQLMQKKIRKRENKEQDGGKWDKNKKQNDIFKSNQDGDCIKYK